MLLVPVLLLPVLLLEAPLLVLLLAVLLLVLEPLFPVCGFDAPPLIMAVAGPIAPPPPPPHAASPSEPMKMRSVARKAFAVPMRSTLLSALPCSTMAIIGRSRSAKRSGAVKNPLNCAMLR